MIVELPPGVDVVVVIVRTLELPVGESYRDTLAILTGRQG